MRIWRWNFVVEQTIVVFHFPKLLTFHIYGILWRAVSGGGRQNEIELKSFCLFFLFVKKIPFFYFYSIHCVWLQLFCSLREMETLGTCSLRKKCQKPRKSFYCLPIRCSCLCCVWGGGSGLIQGCHLIKSSVYDLSKAQLLSCLYF